MNEAKLILVLEDDLSLREMSSVALRSRGYRVLAAANGLDALQQLQSCLELPKLIVADLEMPVMDGWKFREAQLRDPVLSRIPTLIVSGSTRAQALQGTPGVAGVLLKPVRPSVLVRTVASLC